MPTELVIKQDVLRVLNKRDEVLSRLPVPLVTTSVSPSTTTLRDTRLKRGTTQANRYDAREGEVVETVGGGATLGVAFAVDDAGFNNTDQLTISPATGTAIATGTDYLLYALGLSKEIVDAAIDEMLRETDGPHVFYPSLFDDSDLDSGGVTNWLALGDALTTRELVTTVDNTALIGPAAIHLVEAATSTGIVSNNVPVHDTEEFVLMMSIRPLSGTWTITFHDVTNAATIGSAVVTEEVAWQTIQFRGSIPAACEEVELRIAGSANTEEAFVSAHLVLQMTSGRSYRAPSWLEAETQILGWCYQPVGRGAEDVDTYVALSTPLVSEQAVSVVRDARAVHPFRISLQPGNQAPVALICQREFAELSGVNTATSPVNRQYAKEATLYRILRDLGDPGARAWADAAALSAERLRYGLREIVFEPTPTVPM